MTEYTQEVKKQILDWLVLRLWSVSLKKPISLNQIKHNYDWQNSNLSAKINVSLPKGKK